MDRPVLHFEDADGTWRAIAIGPKGDKGDTGTLNLGTVSTGAAGTPVQITNTGTPEEGVFNFIIPKGDKGDTGTINVGTTSTSAPGTSASVTNTGSLTNAIFNFVIPRGDKGATGTMSVGTVTTGAANTPAAITNSGTPEAGILNFTIPQGIQGIPGSKWYTGAGLPVNTAYALGDWYLNTNTQDVYEKTAATTWTLRTNIKGATGTMQVGSVTTGAPGTSASISNTGTPTNGIFNFTIPRGDVGPQGIQGPSGTIAVGAVATGAPGSAVTITNTGTNTNAVFSFSIPQGAQGIQGVKGDTGTLALGTVTTGAVGSNVVITNTGTPTAGVFNFTIPRGAGVTPGGTTGQFLRKLSNADYDSGWVDAPIPVNMVTTDSAQTISSVKTFTAIPIFPAATVTIANIAATGAPGTGTFLRGDGTWSATPVTDLSNYVTLNSAQTITALKTFNADISVRPGTALATITLADGTITKQAGSGFTLNSSLTASGGLYDGGARAFSANNWNHASTVVAENTYGQAAAVGTGSPYARQDHTHGTPPAQVLTGGTGITATASGVNYTITNTGVTSLVAGTNATVSGATGAVTIGMSAAPVFSGTTDGLMMFNGGAADGTAWIYGQIGVTQKFRVNRNGSANFTRLTVHNGDVLVGSTAAIESDGRIYGLGVYDNGARVYSSVNPQPMTGYTTTADVDARINAIIGSAPSTLDTLNELAAAIGNDPNFATTMTNNINTRALDTTVVHLAGAETITGVKTFNANLVVGTGDVIIGTGNRYVWRFSGNTTLGMRFNDTTGAYQLMSAAGTAALSVSTDGSGISFLGTLTAGTVPWARLSGIPSIVNTVAGRSGAVTLTSADVSGVVDLAGTQTITGQKTFNSVIGLADVAIRFRGVGDANHYIAYSATPNGLDISGFAGGRLGHMSTGTFAPVLTWGTGAVTVTGTLNSTGNLSENGQRVYSPNNLPPMHTNAVSLTLAQNIAGAKTFTDTPVIQGTSPTLRFQDTDNAAGSGISNAFWHLNSGQFYLLADTTGDGAWEATYPILVRTDLSVNFAVGVYDNNNRVYSAANPPPYPAAPVQSVAGRVGAVTLAVGDIADAVSTNTTQTITATKTFAGGRIIATGQTGTDAFSGNGIEVASTGTGVPARIVFHIPNVTAPQIGADDGGLRTFDQGGTAFAPFRAAALYDNGNRVFSASSPNAWGVPFHIGGTVGTGAKSPKFIAPGPLAIRGARAYAETGTTLTYQIYVNGAAISGAASGVGIGAAAPVYYDFADVNINTNDRVQVFVASADATATELSVTLEVVNR